MLKHLRTLIKSSIWTRKREMDNCSYSLCLVLLDLSFKNQTFVVFVNKMQSIWLFVCGHKKSVIWDELKKISEAISPQFVYQIRAEAV